jgi:cathepsin F
MSTNKTTFILLVVCGLVMSQVLPEEQENELFKKFQSFMEQYQKTYENIDLFIQRFGIFKTNYLKALELNATSSDDCFMGVTEFMDLTQEEFASRYLSNSTLPNASELNNTNPFFTDESSADPSSGFLSDDQTQTNSTGRLLQSIPANFDWRSYGAVTNVKNQGSCGGCWAFTAAVNIEGQYAIKYKQSVSMSVQQLIDCSPYDNGCNGGMPHTAYSYIQQSGGIQSWSSYPFLGYQGYCRYNPNAVLARITGYTSAGSTNEDVIAAYLYRTGPLSITINASNLQYYQGGIYNVPYNYCPYAPDHGVNLVGYGVTTSGQKYWIVKNSWGSSWGEAGYFRIARGVGLCGINQYVISATLA